VALSFLIFQIPDRMSWVKYPINAYVESSGSHLFGVVLEYMNSLCQGSYMRRLDPDAAIASIEKL
jgi:hypothetical protein